MSKKAKKKKIIFFSLICSVIIFLLINIYNIHGLNAPDIFDSDYGEKLDLTFDIFEDNILVTQSKLPYSFENSTKNKNIELISTLESSNTLDNTFISFRASGYSVIVEVDNNEIYNFYKEGNKDYGGGYWHFIRLPKNSNDKEIKIKLFCPNDNPFAQNLFPIYNGSKGYLIVEDFKLKYGSLFFGIILITFGIVFFISLFFLKKPFVNSIILSLALLLLCFGFWIFSQSGSKQIVGITNPALPMVISFFTMVSFPFFLWYYLNSNYKIIGKIKSIKYFAFIILFLYIPISILTFFDISYTKFVTLIGLLIFIFSLLVLINAILIYKKGEKDLKSCVIAFSAIFISVFAEMLLLVLKINITNISLLHIGMAFASLIFIYKTIGNLIEKNIEDNEAKIFKKLAFLDIITLLKNRNAYEKFLQEDAKKYDKLGIILSDVNGLKKYNDEFGHKYGDLLLKKMANLLIKYIPSNSITFRIGGDEFVSIIMIQSKEKFGEIVSTINEKFTPSKEDFGMAIGSYFYEKGKDIDLGLAIELADKDMYIQKEKQKNFIKDMALSKKHITILEKEVIDQKIDC